MGEACSLVVFRRQHSSHICQLWAASEEIAHLSGSAAPSVFTVHILQPTVDSTSGATQKPAHWNLFITAMETISALYMFHYKFLLWSLRRIVSFERKYWLPVGYLYLNLLFHLSLLCFPSRHMSLSLYSSYTLSLQVQTGPLKSSGLVRFQIDRRVLAGPPQICFSSAEKMERLLFFLLIACDEWHVITTRSISAEQWSHLDKCQLWSGNVLSGNLSNPKKKNKKKILGYFMLMNVNHQD